MSSLYQLTSGTGVIRTSDGASIPNNPANRDWVEYQAWVAAGNTADPYVAPVVPQTVLPQDIIAQFAAADITSITTATASNPDFALLWYSFLAQKDAMQVSNARFQSGWAALVTVLGQPRMTSIAAALGINV